MSWFHRLDNIGQRDWDDLITAWDEYGRGFDTANFLNNSLEDSLESRIPPTALNSNSLLHQEFDDRRPSLSELVFAQVKANHAVISALRCITDGSASWGVANAYHASMLLMRSPLAAFGIFVC